MRRFLSLFTMLMLCGVLAFAQSRVVTGKVTDANGNPVSFASVKVKGTNTGVSADANGAYSLKVNPNSTLVISGAGFNETEVPVGTQNVLNTVMEKAKGELTEVVVTSAFNTKRTARSVSSNAQVITGEQLNTVRQTNINNALAGKVAGIQVRSQSAANLGKETAVRVRGESNAAGNASSPIYVIDGTIMPSNADINPDDIEDISFLQGPQGAALFGSDGANGAIVITTKKARKGAPGIGIDINSGIQYDKVYILPNYQNSYGGGGSADFKKYTYVAGQPELWKQLDGKYMPDYSDDASWGPRMSGQEFIPWYAWYPGHERSGKTALYNPQPRNSADFFNTAVTKLNNISFAKATDNANLRLSYTNLDQSGLIPTSYLKRHTFNASTGMELGKFTISSNLTYLTQKTNAENDDGYSNQSTGSFNSWFHRDLDMNILRELQYLKSPDGTFASWNKSGPGAYSAANPNAFYRGNYWFNFYTYFNNVSNVNQKDRFFGDVTLLYKINSDLSLRGTYRKQQLTTYEDRIVTSALEYSGGQTSVNNMFGSNASAATAGTNSGKAFYGNRSTFSNRNVFEGALNYRKTYRSFQLNSNLGFEVTKIRTNQVMAQTLGGLNVPDLYVLSNSKNPADVFNQRTEEKRRAAYIRGDLGYKNMLFAEFVVRDDVSSTLPKGKNLITYSGGLSFVFSDLTKKALPWLSYGKLRGSYGEVTRVLSAYELATTYALSSTTWNGNGQMGVPNNIPDPGLTGAKAKTTEFGIDLRFFKSRVGISGTYYIAEDLDAPISGQISGTSGFTSVTGNFGSTKRRGIDIQLNLRPIASKNFDWTLNATFSKLLENTVVKIAPGVDQLTLGAGNGGSGASFSSIVTPIVVNKVGEQWGQLYGGVYNRDAAGRLILDSVNLLPTKATDLGFLGSVLPDYTGGVQNTFTVFKNFVFNINIDYQVGGKFFSLSDMWGSYSGLLARTAVLNDKGNPIRDAVGDGGGVKVTGVNEATKAEVTRYVDAQTYFHAITDRNIFNDYVYDLTFVKLRELSVGYRIPVSKLGIGKYLQNATFSIVARNPWLIYAKTKDFDPSEITNVFGENGQLPGTRSLGVNLKLGF